MKIEVLRKYWVDQSLESRASDFADFKKWLAKENYYVNAGPTEQSFSLYVRDSSEFKKAMSFDSFRMGMNALQSVHGIRKNPAFTKLTAWHLIQAYYAAFYAAHSTLRIFGRPFLYLEAGHSAQISNRIKTELGIQCRILSGNYLAAYDSKNNNLTFYHKRDSHKDLWSQYAKLLSSLSTDVFGARAAQQDLVDISGFFDGVNRFLNRGAGNGTGNWLSIFRNEVSYRSYDEAWYPFSNNKVVASKMFDSLSNWKVGGLNIADCESKKTEIEIFIYTCMIVVQLGTELLKDYCVVADSKNTRVIQFQKFYELSKSTFEI